MDRSGVFMANTFSNGGWNSIEKQKGKNLCQDSVIHISG